MYPSTPKEAYRSGSKYYFTGRPCPAGHIAPKYESTRRCVECSAISVKAAGFKYRPLSEKAKAAKNARLVMERQQNPIVAFKHAVRTNVNRAFARKGMKKNAKTEALLGCTVDEFRAHIERQFLPGMGWHNRDRWHIDHIVPLKTANTIEEVAALCHHTNLRPIWKDQNLKKSAKQTHLL